MSEKTLRICHLYPDLLNLYGDRGNILCMRRRLEWRGIGAEVTEVTVGQQADFTRFDLFFIGGGQDFEQEVLLSDLKAGKGGEIKAAIADGKTFLTICGGYQMLGSYYRTWDGKQCDFIGAIDYYTVGSKERMIGNFLFECLPKSGGSTVVGFETTAARPTLAAACRRSARCSSVAATTGRTALRACAITTCSVRTATARSCRKPAFCDHLLTTALQQRYPELELQPLDDAAELAAHNTMRDRLLKNNCMENGRIRLDAPTVRFRLKILGYRNVSAWHLVPGKVRRQLRRRHRRVRRPQSGELCELAGQLLRRIFCRRASMFRSPSRLESLRPSDATSSGVCAYSGARPPSVSISQICRGVESSRSRARTTRVMPISISSTLTASW